MKTMAFAALAALWLRRFALARMAAIGQVALILVGWSVSQYPNLITPDVTVVNAHAPELTLRLLVLALGAGAIVLLVGFWFDGGLFRMATAIPFWILLELGATESTRPKALSPLQELSRKDLDA